MVGLHQCANGGVAYEERECGEGWGPCDLATGLQSRSGEVRPCRGAVSGSGSLTMGTVVGGVVSGFLAGLVLGAGLVFYYFRFRKHGVHGAPHYLSAKSNNLYVSLPMLDLKNKHYNQSDFDTLRSTSTVRSRAESSIYSGGGGGSVVGPKVAGGGDSYETATIKRSRSQSHRNSALLNGATLRADLDSDQLFN